MTLGSGNNHHSQQPAPSSDSWHTFMTDRASEGSSLVPAFQATSLPENFPHLSVSDILSTYEHDTDLLKHVLAAKAQEDRRKTAEEFRQAEEARLRSKFAEFNMDDYQQGAYASADKKQSIILQESSSTAYQNQAMMAESSLQARKQYDLRDDPIQLDLLLSSPPQASLSMMMTDQDTPSIYVTDHHHSRPSTDTKHDITTPIVPSHNINMSVPTPTSFSLPSSFATPGLWASPLATSGLSPHFDSFLSPTARKTKRDLTASPSSSTTSSASSASSVDFRQQSFSNKLPSFDMPRNSGTSEKKENTKQKRRQSSITNLPGFSPSTHVMRWAATKKKKPVPPPMVNVNQEPHTPLDHGVVMDKLRAKLMRIPPEESSTAAEAPMAAPPPIPSPSPPPPPPPPVDTQPTTGILFLDLKNMTTRRKKSYSVTNDCRYC